MKKTLRDRLEEFHDDLFINDKEIETVILQERIWDIIEEVGELEYRMESLEK